jgi:hypothetical protein
VPAAANPQLRESEIQDGRESSILPSRRDLDRMLPPAQCFGAPFGMPLDLFRSNENWQSHDLMSDPSSYD